MPQDEIRSGFQLQRRLIGTLGDNGIDAQGHQILDAAVRFVPYLDPEFQANPARSWRDGSENFPGTRR
jgi:hypothetical protein